MNIELKGKVLSLVEGDMLGDYYYRVSMTRTSTGSIETRHNQFNSKVPFSISSSETLTTNDKDFRMYHIMLRENNL